MSTEASIKNKNFDLSKCEVIANPTVESLIQDCIDFDGDQLASNGAVVALSGKYTGRTPKDKHTVRSPRVENDIWWEANNAMSPEVFTGLKEKAQRGLDQKKIYQIDLFAGADPKYRIGVRFLLERPYHALFIRQLLIRPTEAQLNDFQPDWTVLNLCRTKTDPDVDHVRSEATVALNYESQEGLIFGTEYAGEIKKSIFTVMNYRLPLQGVMSMHCSANVGKSGDVALFFGLSGTGKTTLSADPDRLLIGDDEHGWSDEGVFNIEGGCYAKCVKLHRETEPEIWDAIRHGAVLENVILNADGTPNYDNTSLTENTRCAYPIEHIDARAIPSVGGHPQNIFFLTCDALGILPPISKLTAEQAMDQFLVGYTAKVAGTEVGVTEPVPSFSTCFAKPFLPLHPERYANLLREKIKQHGTRVWLINTGWTGGPYGVGSRIKLAYSRAILSAVFAGKLDQVATKIHPVFGYEVPLECEGVPREVLDPRESWADKAAYDAKANELKRLLEEHKTKF